MVPFLPSSTQESYGSADLPTFKGHHQTSPWPTMHISLPDALQDFLDEQVKQRGYSTTSEYVRELILHDQDRLRLRGLLLAGATSSQNKLNDGAYSDGQRRSVRSAERKNALDQVVAASEDVDGYDLCGTRSDASNLPDECAPEAP